MGVRVDRGHVGGGPAVPHREQLGDAVGAVRRGELDAERGRGAALVRHHGDPVGQSGARRLVPAPPLVTGLPGRHQAGQVGRGAHRDPAGHPVQGAALGVGGHHHVDRFGPPVDGPVHVGGPARPQQRQQGGEAEVAGDAGRVAQGDGERGFAGRGHAVVEALGAADDDRAAVGLDDLDLDRFPARHLDGLGVPGGPVPLPVRAERLHAVPQAPGSARAGGTPTGAPQPLPVEVLVVGHGVGDGPGDRAGVAEVGDAGDAGHGEADDVELRAGQADLLVDAGVLDEAVRVPGDDRPTGDRALPGDQPAVAARGAGAVGGEQADGVRAEVGGDVLAPQLGGEAGEEDVGGEPDREGGPGLPAAGGEGRAGELGGGGGAQPLVDARRVGPDPVGRLRVRPLQCVPAAAGRVGQAGAAGEAVPGQGPGTEEGRRGALRAVPFHLQLPGPVEGGDPALEPCEPVRVVRAQVGDPPGVPKDLAGHCALISL
ncbi:hypothetical protein SGRIM128S_01033 [Streptomyces griseomycini]